MRVFVTGANGLVGANVSERLMTQGHSVTGLVRDIIRYPGKTGKGIRLVTGDITDIASFREEMKGCDSLVHAAALTDMGLPRYTRYRQVNVKATADLMEAAAECGIRKVVYISSANTIGYGTATEPGNEDTPLRYPHTESLYARSKTEAEEIVKSWSGVMEVVILNPVFILGRYASADGSGRLVEMGRCKRVIFYPPGGKSFVHVADVAEAVEALLSSERREHARQYLLAGDNLTYREFFKLLTRITGEKPLLIQVPSFILLLAAIPGTLLRAAGFRSELSLANLQILAANTFYTGKRSEEMLGIRYKSTGSAVRDTLKWFSEQG
jgi:nucleoside-diphosphate-sugar epimerase